MTHHLRSSSRTPTTRVRPAGSMRTCDPDRARQEARQAAPRVQRPTDLPSQALVEGHRRAVVRVGPGLPSSASWRTRNGHLCLTRRPPASSTHTRSAAADIWTYDRWQRVRSPRILTTSGSDARMRIVESKQAERIANELAALLAQE